MDGYNLIDCYLLNIITATRKQIVPITPTMINAKARESSTIVVGIKPKPAKKAPTKIARRMQIIDNLALLAFECDFSKLVFAMITLLSPLRRSITREPRFG